MTEQLFENAQPTKPLMLNRSSTRIIIMKVFGSPLLMSDHSQKTKMTLFTDMLRFVEEKGCKVIMAVYASPCDMEDSISFELFNGDATTNFEIWGRKKKSWVFRNDDSYNPTIISDTWKTFDEFKVCFDILIQKVSEHERELNERDQRMQEEWRKQCKAMDEREMQEGMESLNM